MERGQVAQASGMVSVQAGCTPDQALALMNARAEKCGRKVEEIAVAVVERRIRFDSPPNP
jgi:AmiR/NasT family two-component response regulator